MKLNEGENPEDEVFLTASEQSYLKQIYLYTETEEGNITTKDLAVLVKTRPASVSSMLQKLAAKNLIIYNKYYGSSLSNSGMQLALEIIRRNRLWELFLYEKLAMDWKEIDVLAGKLQSVTSSQLTEKLNTYLGNPTYDPHGEAIPDESGNIPETNRLEIYDLKIGQSAKIIGFRDTSAVFLEYVEKLQLLINNEIKIMSLVAYDNSLEVKIENNLVYLLSKEVAQKIFVAEIK